LADLSSPRPFCSCPPTGASLRLFFVVDDLDQAQPYYDALFQQAGGRSERRLSYLVDGTKLDFYQLSDEQGQEFQLEPGKCGICLEGRPDLKEGWVRPWGPAPWGGSLAHLQDPFGFRWEFVNEKKTVVAKTETL